jgi:hypothetical protein
MAPRVVMAAMAAAALSAVSLAVAVGCNGTAASSFPASDDGTGSPGQNPSDPELKTSDDGGAEPTTAKGNPLCYASYLSSCYPDQTFPDDAGRGCSDDGRDAAAAQSDGGKNAGACHVRYDATGDAGAAPVCLSAGKGEDGAECIRSTDCAAGFECVGSPAQCRHYCCDGDSVCPTGGKHFCDIQVPAEQGALKVPVCMPVRQCVLLGEGCTQGETCSVVDDKGTTSCIGVGPAKAGESCETAHCSEGLTCLGQPGMRRCYTLCRKNASMACAIGERCKGSAPLFQDPNIGICSKDVNAAR